MDTDQQPEASTSGKPEIEPIVGLDSCTLLSQGAEAVCLLFIIGCALRCPGAAARAAVAKCPAKTTKDGRRCGASLLCRVAASLLFLAVVLFASIAASLPPSQPPKTARLDDHILRPPLRDQAALQQKVPPPRAGPQADRRAAEAGGAQRAARAQGRRPHPRPLLRRVRDELDLHGAHRGALHPPPAA